MLRCSHVIFRRVLSVCFASYRENTRQRLIIRKSYLSLGFALTFTCVKYFGLSYAFNGGLFELFVLN